MVSLYLDDCITDHRLARQLRAAGHLLYLPTELGLGGRDDELHLIAAAERGALLATHDQGDFTELHEKWQREARRHSGILLVRERDDIGRKLELLERAARLLTTQAARSQLIPYQMFSTEDGAAAYVSGLGGRE